MMALNLSLWSTTKVKEIFKTARPMSLYAAAQTSISESPLCLYTRNERNEPAVSL